MSITESPILMIVIGLTTAVLLGGLWLQTGKRALLVVGALVLALTAAGVMFERSIETDRERVEKTLHQIAREIEQNDRTSVLGHFHSKAQSKRQSAHTEMGKYRFENVKIKSNLKVTLDANSDPKTATAKFNVVVVGSGGGLGKGRRVPRFMTLELEQEDGAWRVVDYDHEDPTMGFKKRRSGQ